MKSNIPKNRQGAQPQNMSAMIRQAQKMQTDIQILQEEIEARTFEAESGGGVVKVQMLGSKKIQSLKIDPEVVKENVEEVSEIEDLVLSAINACIDKIDEVTEDEMSKMTGGVSLPGLF